MHFGGHSVFLDRTGAAVIKDLGIIVLNRIAWSDSQGELFPEQSDSARSGEPLKGSSASSPHLER